MGSLLTTSRGAVTIRIAVPDDAVSLRALRLEALASHPEVFAADYAAVAAESVERWVERIAGYAQDNEGTMSVASAGDSLIGMMGLVRGHWPKTRHCGTLWGGLYVKADWRGLHVAEALIRECTGWAQAQGLLVMKLGVVTTNTSAIRCYERCGFAVYGTDPKVIYYKGVFYDEFLMSKLI